MPDRPLPGRNVTDETDRLAVSADGKTLLRNALPPNALPPGEELGERPRYRLDRCLGGGAFGAVYEATTLDPGDTASPERVAIKVLHGELPGRHRSHVLKRELSSLRAIHCERIPTVFHADVNARLPYLVMEYFSHGTLEDHLELYGQLDAEQARALMVCLLEATDAAHQADVLHLDIKPANVLLDGKGGFVLTDFGISQAPRVSLAMAGLGSPGWHAPEQERRETDRFDRRTDLFGIGATMWSALTGVDLGTPHGQAQRGRASLSPIALPPVSTRTPCDPDLEGLVMWLLASDPNHRPGSAQEVITRMGGGSSSPKMPGRGVDADEVEVIIDRIVDPLVSRLFSGEQKNIRRLDRGDVLCTQGESSHFAFALLYGTLRVERDGAEIGRIEREGQIVGEVAALTGAQRYATLVADDDAAVWVMNAAQLENLVVANPALAVRLIRTMAHRINVNQG
jgi:serine/threonine protein kinase